MTTSGFRSSIHPPCSRVEVEVLSGLLKEDQASLWLKTLGDRALAACHDEREPLEPSLALKCHSTQG